MQIKKLLLLPVLIFSIGCFSQIKNFVKINDSLVGNENLAYYNGLAYVNKYQNTSRNTSQYLENKYDKGVLQFNDQTYYDVNMKYDVLEDVLLFKPTTQLAIETSLITKQVDYFFIKNRKFKKLETITSDNVVKVGYFEENEINEKSTLYIKYKKTVKVDSRSDNLSHVFFDYKSYYLFYNNKLEEISSKNDVIKLLPTLKKEIKQYYKKNQNLKITNTQLFYQNLFKTVI